MSEYIEECRREWKRLRVPDQIADEMAADLATDLQEAEAEGASPEDVLGSSASDPRAFAASWAAERGVSGPRFRDRFARGPLLLGAAALLIALAAGGLAVARFSSNRQAHTPTVTTNAAVPVPANVGLQVPLAVRHIQAAGLAVKIVFGKHAGLRAGTVVAQAPAAGNDVVRGATVVLFVTECSNSSKKPCQYP